MKRSCGSPRTSARSKPSARVGAEKLPVLPPLCRKSSGRRDLNPRPPEPHAVVRQPNEHQLVGFTRGYECRCRIELVLFFAFGNRN